MKKLVLLFIAVAIAPLFAEDKAAEKTVEKPVIIMNTSMGDIHIELNPAAAPKTVQNFIDLAEGKKEFTKDGKKVTQPFYDGLIFHRVIKGFMLQGGCPQGSGMGDPGYKFEDEISAKALGLDKELAFPNGRPNPLLGGQRAMQAILAPIYKEMGINSQETFKAKQVEFLAAIAKITLEDAFKAMGYKYDDKLKSMKALKGCIAMANSGPNTNGSQFFINLGDTPHLNGKHTVFGKVIKGMAIVEKIGNVTVKEGSKPQEDVKIIKVRLKK